MIRSCLLWVKHLVYAVAVLAILACLMEIGLRVYDSATAQVTRRDLYDRGMVCKSWFVHHSLKPSRAFAAKDPDSGQRVRVNVNSLGLRGPEPAMPKPPGTIRIICLGDDATFAPTIPEADTFCSQLRATLTARMGRQVEVINAGVPDYCPLLSALKFRHELLALAPDLVILNFDMSDVADDYEVRRFAVVNREGTPLSCSHPALEMPRQGKRPRENVLLLPQFARQKVNDLLANRTLGESSRSIDSPKCRYMWLDDTPPDWSVYIDQTLSPLRPLDDMARGMGAKLLIAACPAPWQASPQASNGEGVREQAGIGKDACFKSRRPFEIIGQFCKTNQIPFCDLSPAFAADGQPERLYQKNAAALSIAGHALYASSLAEFVLEQAHAPASSPGSPGPANQVPQASLSPTRK
ncbi:MAG: SGNH/GDSL hydrolase family protein [Planctomycetia bacterium]|nr:SGNH/GDSL hydrolase family protein [Planctomycetia bacterium]